MSSCEDFLDLEKVKKMEFSVGDIIHLKDVELENAKKVATILDQALSFLPNSRRIKCHNALRDFCEKRLVLPNSYTLETDAVSVLDESPRASGSFSKIWAARYKGRYVAVKSLHKKERIGESEVLKNLYREIVAWKCLSHPNIVPLLGKWKSDLKSNPDGKELRHCLVSNWYTHGNVNQFLKINKHASRLKLLAGIASGLAYLHKLDIVHADLKGDNVLVSDDYEACLTDFGLTKIVVSSRPVGFEELDEKRTLGFAAPELQETRKHSKEADVFAFGMVIYEVMTGRSPFTKAQISDSLEKKMRDEGLRPERPSPKKKFEELELSEKLWDIAEQCWKYAKPPKSNQGRPEAKDLEEKLDELVKDSKPPLLEVNVDSILGLKPDPDNTPSPVPLHEVPEYKKWKDRINVVIIGHAKAGKTALFNQLFKSLEDESKADAKLLPGIPKSMLFESSNYNILISDIPTGEHLSRGSTIPISQADVAIIVVAGYTDQENSQRKDWDLTAEHIELALGYGIRQFIVVCSNMDKFGSLNPTAKSRFVDLTAKVTAHITMLSRIRPALIPCIPTSIDEAKGLEYNISNGVCSTNLSYDGWKKDSRKGPTEGLSVKAAIWDLDKPKRQFDDPLRIPISDVLERKSGEFVVTGRVAAGILQRKMMVRFVPGGITGEVMWIEVRREDVPEGIAGEIVSFCVSGSDIIERGKEIVCGSVASQLGDGQAKEAISFVARLEILKQDEEYSDKALKRLELKVHTATAKFNKVKILNRRTKNNWSSKEPNPTKVEPGDVFEAEFELEPERICIERQDTCRPLARIILHDPYVEGQRQGSRMVVAIGFICSSKTVLP